MSLCMFLFSGHIHGTKLELFSVWLVCHVLSDFDSCKIFKTEQERERGGRREMVGERERERERERGREKEREGERERKREREGGRERERERERAGWGGWEEEGQRVRRKMVQKNSRTLPIGSSGVHTKCMTSKTWVVKICSHSLAMACLTTLSCRTKLWSPPDIRPDASRLRMLFIMSSCADGDRSETSPPQTQQQRRAWPMTFHCFSKSTVLFDIPSRKKAS